MNLDSYLKTNGIKDADFAEKIGVTSRSVEFYRKGERIPRPRVMADIEKATGGLVKPGSFYKPVSTKETP